MIDVGSRVAESREHVRPEWTAHRERAVRLAVERRAHARTRKRLGIAVAVAAAALVVFVVARHPRTPPELAARSAPPEPAETLLLRLEDGSTAAPLSADARVAPVEVGPHGVSVRVESGRARFSVTPNPDRIFRVTAGNTSVTVLGTVFSVGIEPSGVRVAVERGRVHVAWPTGERDLGVGEVALVAPEEAAPPPPAAPSALAPPEHASRGSSGGPAVVPGPSWRELAEEGDYGASYSRMMAEGPSAVRDDPGDLLLAADVARLGGHPERAIAPLERVVASHSADSRAPLAAFTLGRTLLDQLGKPHEAAQAFATARRLAPRGAIAEDALAREIESWSRAGDTSRARERAEAYLRAYPNGRRLAAVKRLGGL
jgi:transmembrane sensor